MLALVALHFGLYQTLCAIKLRWYLYRDFDLAIFVQAVHGVLRGSWFSSIRGMPWLGDHSSLILVPLAPLYALAPTPLTLLAIQSAALASAAIPAWLLARRELPAGPLPVACAAMVLLHPALGYLNLFEFHPETLAVPLLLWAALEVRHGGAGRAALAAGLALLTREDVALPVLALAAVAVLQRPRRPRTALALAALAVLSLLVSFAWLKPALLAGQAEYGRLYARWGGTPLEILRGLATHPLDALGAFFGTPGNADDTALKREFWQQLFLPVGFLSLLAPLWLLPALPVFAEHLLAARTHQHTIVFQYTALSLPFVVVAAVIGARAVVARLPARAVAVGLVVLGLGAQVAFGPLPNPHPWQHGQRNEPILPGAFERAMRPYRDRMLARVPRRGAVIAGFEFLPALAARPDVHSLHHLLTGHYTYSDRPYPPPRDVGAILGDFTSLIPNLNFGSGARVRGVLAANHLAAADAAGGTLLFLAGARDTLELWSLGPPWPGESLEMVADDQLLFYGAQPFDTVVTRGGVLPIAYTWKRIAPGNRRYLAQTWLARGRREARYMGGRAIGYGIFPPTDWPADSVVREIHYLLVPGDVPPGPYRIDYRLYAVDANGLPEVATVEVQGRREPMNVFRIGDVTVKDGAPR